MWYILDHLLSSFAIRAVQVTIHGCTETRDHSADYCAEEITLICFPLSPYCSITKQVILVPLWVTSLTCHYQSTAPLHQSIRQISAVAPRTEFVLFYQVEAKYYL